MDKEREADRIAHEQFWFTATTLGFIGFVATSADKWGFVKSIVLSVMVVLISAFTVYILVERFKKYRHTRNEEIPDFFVGALKVAIKEFEGTFYCIAVVFLACLGVCLSIWF